MSVALRLKEYGSLVAFSHTVFALPFAATAVVLSFGVPHSPLTARRILAMLIAMVAARTSAMAFNRWADRHIDAENPRTRERHLPAGRVKAAEALALALGSGLLFIAAAAALGVVPGVLSPVVLAVLLGYSYAKRFTWAAHAWLGLALSLAPGGAWIAMGARPSFAIGSLMTAVVTWLFGFDILYSLQDESFDREHGLHSVPARFGTIRSLVISAAAHVVTVTALAVTGLLLHRGPAYFVGVSLTTILLCYEHLLVGKGNLARIDRAFFDINAWVSVGFFVFTLVDVCLRAAAF